MSLSTVSKKGLTTIPREVRKELDIKEGDLLRWEIIEKEKAAIVKPISDPLVYLKGRLKDPELTYEKVEHLADKLIVKELARH